MASRVYATDNALDVLRARYLQRDASGDVVESPEALCSSRSRA